MVTDFPKMHQIPMLRQLWKTAFGDPDAFLDGFFETGFSPSRCRCITDGQQVAAMLYWFDCEYRGQKLAYLYAVATHPEYRNRGLCHRLMENTHALLAEKGYAGALLVPQEESLRTFYGKMGYQNTGNAEEFTAVPGEKPAYLERIVAKKYATLRRQYLPDGGVLQEGESLAFLERTYELYAGKDFLLTAFREDGFLFGAELLGNRAAAPEILKALDCVRGKFRTPGDAMPFAMFLPLAENAVPPTYFGLAFD